MPMSNLLAAGLKKPQRFPAGRNSRQVPQWIETIT